MNAWDFCKMMGFNLYLSTDKSVDGVSYNNNDCLYVFCVSKSDTQEEIKSQAAKIILEKLGEILSKEFNN